MIKFFSGNFIKLIALVSMTIDHIGYILFPDVLILRLIGRLAFPIYAYFIAEGCVYTKNKYRYFFTILGLGLACQLINIFLANDNILNILLTFSLSIIIIYLIQFIKKSISDNNTSAKVTGIVYVLLAVTAIYIFTFFVKVDYGFIGVLLAPLVSLFSKRSLKIIMLSVGLILLSIFNPLQWFSLLAVLPILLYNGKRGKFKFKYLFYGYYPAHLIIIYLIKMLI